MDVESQQGIHGSDIQLLKRDVEKKLEFGELPPVSPSKTCIVNLVGPHYSSQTLRADCRCTLCKDRRPRRIPYDD